MNTLIESFSSSFTGNNASAFAFDMAVRSTVLLLVALIALAICRCASAAARHRLWLLSVVGVLLIPIFYLAVPQLKFVLPGGDKPARFSEATSITSQWLFTETIPTSKPSTAQPAALARPETLEAASMTGAVAEAPVWHTGDVLLVAWAAGVGVVGLLSLISIASAQWLVRKSAVLTDDAWQDLLLRLRDELGISRTVQLRSCDRPISPMTWGLWRPVILLPRDCASWTDECRRAVLLHELAHIQRHDWLSQMLAQTACVVYWFHPLVWFANRQVRKESDRAADDVVLTTGMPATTYAEQLLLIAQQISAEWLHPAPAMARRGQLSQRIGVLLDPRRNRCGLGRRAAVLMTVVAICAVVFIGVVSVTVAGDETAAAKSPSGDKQAAKPVETAREQIERALRSKTEFDFQDQPLSDVLWHFKELHNIQIVIDDVALNDEGISPDSPVNMKLAGVTTEFALRSILDPLQLESVIKQNVLMITTKRVAEEILETRAYNLGQMLDLPATNFDRESLIKVITTCVAPDSWEEIGGPGVISSFHPKAKKKSEKDEDDEKAVPPPKPILPGILLIRQTGRIHQDIVALLAEIKSQCHPLVDKKHELTTPEKNQQAIRNALNKNIDLNHADVPLVDVITDLGKKYEINVLIDELALNDEGISPDSPITLTAKGISLRNYLQLALEPLQLTAVIDGEALKITTKRVAEEIQLVRIHNVSDFPLDGDFSGLISAIQSTVVPDTWEAIGGAGNISPLTLEAAAENGVKAVRLLIVQQTEQGHEQVAALLEQLRRVK